MATPAPPTVFAAAPTVPPKAAPASGINAAIRCRVICACSFAPEGKRVPKYGDSASVQAATRVNADQDAQADPAAVPGKAFLCTWY